MPIPTNSAALERILRERQRQSGAPSDIEGTTSVPEVAKNTSSDNFMVTDEVIFDGLVYLNGSDLSSVRPKQPTTSVVELSSQPPRTGYTRRMIGTVEVSFKGLAPEKGAEVTWFIYMNQRGQTRLRCK